MEEENQKSATISTIIKLCQRLLPSTLEGKREKALEEYKAFSGCAANDNIESSLSFVVAVAYAKIAWETIHNMRTAALSAKKGFKLPASEWQRIKSEVNKAAEEEMRKFFLSQTGAKTLAEALTFYSSSSLCNDPQIGDKVEKASFGLLAIKGVFERERLPKDGEDLLAVIQRTMKQVINSFSKYEHALSGMFSDMFGRMLAKGARLDLEEFSYNGLIDTAFEHKPNFLGEEVLHFRQTHKSGHTFASMEIEASLIPTSERAMSVFVYFLNRIEKAFYVKAKAVNKRVLVALNVNDLVGEGKPFTEKRYAITPFKQIKEALLAVKYFASYDVQAANKKYCITTDGRKCSGFDPSKGDYVELVHVFRIGWQTEDPDTFYLSVNDDIKDFRPILHKLLRLPYGMGATYNDKEQALFIALASKARSGKRKGRYVKMDYADVLDVLGFKNIQHARNKGKILEEICSIADSIRKKDGASFFKTLEVKYSEGEKTAYAKIKTLSICFELQKEYAAKEEEEDEIRIVELEEGGLKNIVKNGIITLPEIDPKIAPKTVKKKEPNFD